MTKQIYVLHDLINGNALEQFETLEEAQEAATDTDVIYRYDVVNGKGKNPVKIGVGTKPGKIVTTDHMTLTKRGLA